MRPHLHPIILLPIITASINSNNSQQLSMAVVAVHLFRPGGISQNKYIRSLIIILREHGYESYLNYILIF